MAIRRRPDHREHILKLRRMTSTERLAKMFELSDRFKRRYRKILRNAYPELSEQSLNWLYIERVAKHADWTISGAGPGGIAAIRDQLRA